MPLPALLLTRWTKMGTYARLFVPITLLIVTVVCARYTLLVHSEADQARRQFVLEAQRSADSLAASLRPLAREGDVSGIATLLRHAAARNPAIVAALWQEGSAVREAWHAEAQADYPSWFPGVARIAPYYCDIPVGAHGKLSLTFRPTLALNDAWHALRRQAMLSLLNIVLIYVLLGLLIHAVRRFLRRVGLAARAFRDGEFDVRLPVSGFPEAQQLARTFNDMAGRIQDLMAQLRAEKERSEVTLASIGDAVIVADAAGRIRSMNRTAEQLTGYASAEAQGRDLHDVFTLANNFGQHTLLKSIAQLAGGGPVAKARDQSLRDRKGERYNIEYTAAPIRGAEGDAKPAGIVLVFRDVSERRQLIQQISWRSQHDVLTGLPNRAALAARLDHEIARARADDTLLAVCLFDLDHFRQVNDGGGHALGDEVLKQAANRLHDFAGALHYVARLGGDEFVLLLREHKDRAQVEKTLERLMLSLSRSYHGAGRTIPMTASAGVALFRSGDAASDSLLRHADQALYQAKLQGRSKFHFFDAAADEQVRTYHNRRTEVRDALLAGQLCLFYQPKADLRHGRIVGMEALLRWRHPERGIVGPLEFLPAVEHTDLIAEIGERVMRDALAQIETWLAAGREWVVGVNIAARHFQRPDFVARLRAILAEHPDVPPRLLELEILESSALHDVTHVRGIMQECQALGIRFALDDFGTGYSSMSYLKRLPADVLKIDQSFVRNMLVDRDDLHLVAAVIGLARTFRRDVLAEGVETAEHGALLIRLGCDHAQGYGIARPMPPEDVLAWADAFRPAPEWANASLLGPLKDLDAAAGAPQWLAPA